MKQVIRGSNTMLQNGQQALIIREKGTNITKYYTFNILPVEEPIWTPESQKSIFLTAVQASAPLAVTILLSSGLGNIFYSLRITEPFATVSQYFPSPYRLQQDNAILVSTSDEELACDTSGASNAAQVPVNGRSDFINVANASGLANGSFATLNSGLLTQTRGRIVLDYHMLPASYSRLQIKSVVIKYYCRLALTVAVGTSSMILYWRPDSADNWIELQQISLSLIGTLDYLTNPVEQDITDEVLAAVDPWEIIDNLQTSFVGMHTGLGLGNTIQLDAVEIEICMTGNNQITLFGYEA